MLAVYFNPFDGKFFTLPQKIGSGDSPTFENLVITGDLTVSGNNYTVSDLFIEDKTITLSSGANTSLEADNSGITIDGASVNFLYNHAETAMELDVDFIPETTNTYDIGNSTYKWKDGWFANTVTATDFNSTSDLALKTDIVRINEALDKVKALNGYLFTYKKTNQRSSGVIAQEVEKVIPEVVSGPEGSKTVSYGNLVGVLIEAVKELETRIKNLENINIRDSL